MTSNIDFNLTYLAVTTPRRVRIVVAPIDPLNPAAMKEERSGSIRTSIQGQSGGAVAAAGERIAGRGGAGIWCWRRYAGALAQQCAVASGA